MLSRNIVQLFSSEAYAWVKSTRESRVFPPVPQASLMEERHAERTRMFGDTSIFSFHLNRFTLLQGRIHASCFSPLKISRHDVNYVAWFILTKVWMPQGQDIGYLAPCFFHSVMDHQGTSLIGRQRIITGIQENVL